MKTDADDLLALADRPLYPKVDILAIAALLRRARETSDPAEARRLRLEAKMMSGNHPSALALIKAG